MVSFCYYILLQMGEQLKCYVHVFYKCDEIKRDCYFMNDYRLPERYGEG